MKKQDIEVGHRYVYYPPGGGHFYGIAEAVEATGARVKLRVYTMDHPYGIVRVVSPRRLEGGQTEIFDLDAMDDQMGAHGTPNGTPSRHQHR